MKHWASSYTFDDTALPRRPGGPNASRRVAVGLHVPPQQQHLPGESRHESSHHNNSAHWSSIVDPYSAHDPAVSVHDGTLYAKKATSNAPSDEEDTTDAEDDPVRPPPGSPRPTSQAPIIIPEHLSIQETNVNGEGIGGKLVSGPRAWYGQQKKDWYMYDTTLRTTNKTTMQMLGYRSEKKIDKCTCNDELTHASGQPGTSYLGRSKSKKNATSIETPLSSSVATKEEEKHDGYDSDAGTCTNKYIHKECFLGFVWPRILDLLGKRE